MGSVLVIMLRAAGALTVACTHFLCHHFTTRQFEPVPLSTSCSITHEYDCFAMHCKGEHELSTPAYDILPFTALLHSTVTATTHPPKASGSSLTLTLAEQGVLCLPGFLAR